MLQAHNSQSDGISRLNLPLVCIFSTWLYVRECVSTVRKMQQTSLKNEGISRIAMLGLVGAGTAVILTLLLAPWNWMPTEYAEEITVIAVTDYGCVGESQVGNSVVVSDCSASVGDVISAEFYAPASDKNGYYDRIYEKLAVVEP